MLFGVKISDQYVNILSILRGKAVNIQYQYLEKQESIFIQILSSNRKVYMPPTKDIWQRYLRKFTKNGKACELHENEDAGLADAPAPAADAPGPAADAPAPA